MWSLRCRGPHGQATLADIDPATSFHQLRVLLADKTGVAADRQEILCGFPPKQVACGPEDAISSCMTNGEALVVREAPAAAQAAAAEEAAPAAAAALSDVPSAALADMDEDEQLARALAASMADAATPAQQLQQQQQQQQQPARHPVASAAPMGAPTGSGRTANGTGPAPTSVVLPGELGCVVRRIIDSDNSCLFNAVGYIMEHTRKKAPELRRVIAEVVAADPVTYNEGFLAKENEDYCKWILQPKNWGGAIELSILSNHYQCEIAAYDIQTKRCDVYGQDAGYSKRAMVIYDGLHYDALAVGASDGAPEDFDETVITTSSPDADTIWSGAAKLTEACHTARQFTDVANFTLRCGVCQIGIKGEKEATLHAKQTGHTNFSEY